MDKAKAIEKFTGNTSFCRLSPMRRIGLPAITARALGLELPPNCKDNQIVLYYVGDVRRACGMDGDEVPNTDASYIPDRIEQLKNELIPAAETDADRKALHEELNDLEAKARQK